MGQDDKVNQRKLVVSIAHAPEVHHVLPLEGDAVGLQGTGHLLLLLLLSGLAFGCVEGLDVPLEISRLGGGVGAVGASIQPQTLVDGPYVLVQAALKTKCAVTMSALIGANLVMYSLDVEPQAIHMGTGVVAVGAMVIPLLLMNSQDMDLQVLRTGKRPITLRASVTLLLLMHFTDVALQVASLAAFQITIGALVVLLLFMHSLNMELQVASLGKSPVAQQALMGPLVIVHHSDVPLHCIVRG